MVWMADKNRWFTWVYPLKMGGFSMAMLNNQMVMLFGDGFILPLGHPAGSLGTLKLP